MRKKEKKREKNKKIKKKILGKATQAKPSQENINKGSHMGHITSH
jgi:hypothetical protein